MFPRYGRPELDGIFIDVFDEQLAKVGSSDMTYEYRVSLAVEIPLIFLAITAVSLRVFSRIGIKKKLATDDILIIVGTCCALGRTVISCISSGDVYGFNRDGPTTPSQLPYYQHIFERRIAYISSVLFTRLSVLAYYLRIFPPQITTLRYLTIALIIIALAQSIEIITVLAVSCRGISKLWTKDWLSFSGSQCFSSSRYSYSAAIGDTVVDSLIFTLPIPYVWRLSKLRIRQRLGLVLVFSLGFVVCVVALLQIPFIRHREKKSNYFGGTINLLVAIQISLAIVAASLPDLRALIARSFPKFSSLHHRSLVTAAAGAIPRGANGGGSRDVEHGRAEWAGSRGVDNSGDASGATSSGEMQENKGRGRIEAARKHKTPDWLRGSLPASLMGTQVTRTEITRTLSREDVGLPARAPG